MMPLVSTLRMRLLLTVSNIQVAGGIEGHAEGIIQTGVGGRAAIPGIAELPLPATVVMMLFGRLVPLNCHW